jgi:hypothetical protein
MITLIGLMAAAASRLEEALGSLVARVCAARRLDPESLKLGAETYQGELEMDFLSKLSPINNPRSDLGNRLR